MNTVYNRKNANVNNYSEESIKVKIMYKEKCRRQYDVESTKDIKQSAKVNTVMLVVQRLEDVN